MISAQLAAFVDFHYYYWRLLTRHSLTHLDTAAVVLEGLLESDRAVQEAGKLSFAECGGNGKGESDGNGSDHIRSAHKEQQYCCTRYHTIRASIMAGH